MKIFSNTAMSLDGRITTVAGDHLTLGSVHDHRHMSILRDLADAILVGGHSFRNWPHPLLPHAKHLDHAPREERKWNVVLSRSLQFDFSPEYIQSSQITPLFFTSQKKAPTNFPFEVVCHDPITPATLVQELQSRGVNQLLIEAGGDIIYQFLQADLIDEMYITLCPRLIGGRGAASLVDGGGFLKDSLKNLKLLDCRVIGDEIFLHYQAIP